MTAGGTAGQDTRDFDFAVGQHCSAELPGQAHLRWPMAHAEAELDFVASVSSWLAIPVSSVLHHLD